MDRQAFEAAFEQGIEKLSAPLAKRLFGKASQKAGGTPIFNKSKGTPKAAPAAPVAPATPAQAVAQTSETPAAKPILGWKSKAVLAGGTLLAANRIGAAQERQKIQETSPYARLSGNF
jgi:hypothetical protein